MRGAAGVIIQTSHILEHLSVLDSEGDEELEKIEQVSGKKKAKKLNAQDEKSSAGQADSESGQEGNAAAAAASCEWSYSCLSSSLMKQSLLYIVIRSSVSGVGVPGECVMVETLHSTFMASLIICMCLNEQMVVMG